MYYMYVHIYKFSLRVDIYIIVLYVRTYSTYIYPPLEKNSFYPVFLIFLFLRVRFFLRVRWSQRQEHVGAVGQSMFRQVPQGQQLPRSLHEEDERRQCPTRNHELQEQTHCLLQRN